MEERPQMLAAEDLQERRRAPEGPLGPLGPEGPLGPAIRDESQLPAAVDKSREE